MRVTLLGTGSALPSPTRVQSGILTEDDETRLLIDCGSGVLYRLAQVGVDPRDIDAVVLTHTHLDHVADLPGLLKARVLTDHPELTVVGPPDTESVLADLLAVDDLRERADLTVRHVSPGRFEVAGVAFEAHETRHSKRGFAYRVASDLGISGDTAPFEGLIDFFDGVDVLVHECAYPDGSATEGHTTPSALGEVLAGRDVDRVYLTHLFPAAEEVTAELRAGVSARFDGEVVVATDRTTIDM